MRYDPTDLYKEIEQNISAYQTAKTYAEKGGDLIDRDPVLKAALDNRPTRFNFTGSIVKAFTSRLLLAEASVNGMTAEALSAFLKEVRWRIQTVCHIQDLCTYGDAYMMVWPYEDDGDQRVTVRAVDPLSTRVFYDPEDDSPVLGARAWRETSDSGKLYRLNIFDDEKLVRYYSTDKNHWDLYAERDENGEIEPAEVPHDLGTLPILHSRTEYPYGKPVHYEAYGAQDMVMRTVVAHASAMGFQGWPQIYALYEMATGGGTSELGDTMAADEGSDSRSEVQKLKRDPGSIWALHAKELGQLQPADSSNFLDTLGEYIGIAASLAHVPEDNFASPGGQQPSADSQRAKKSDFEQAISRLQDELEGTFTGALSLALTASGTRETSPADVDVPWKAAEIEAGREFWDTALVKQKAGVSGRQTLLEAGYTGTDCDEFTEESGDEDALLRRVTILNTLADAVSKLTSAASTGMIDQQKIGIMIDQLLGVTVDREPLDSKQKKLFDTATGDPTGDMLAKQQAEKDRQAAAAEALKASQNDPSTGGEGVSP